MRVLHIPPRYPPSIGGSEAWCAGLARWQQSQGHEIDVLTLRAVQDDELWGEGPVLPTSVAVGASDVDGGIRIRRFSQGRVGPGAGWLCWRMGISSLAYSHSPELYGLLPRAARAADIVHAHTVPGPHLFACRLAALIARRPFVITPHFHAGDPAHDQAPTRWMLRHADAVFAVSRAEAGALEARGVPAQRIHTTSNAIDRPLSRRTPQLRARIREALELPADPPLITFLGRKAASKSIDLLLDALPLIKRRPAPVLALAGPATSWYRALGDRVRGDNIRDLPPLSETAKSELLAASDLLVLPSKREAFGIVFLEAWSAGAAVIGADIPAVREVIADAGLTFRPDDEVDLAARIDELLAAPEEAHAMAERGRQRINDLYTWERVGSSVMNGYTFAALKGSGYRPRC